jgi:predicted RecA/RadA family phage recombinase
MATYRAEGDKLDYTPTTGVAAGDIVVLGSLVTIADRAIVANELGAVLTNGIVTGPCATGATAALGDAIKWYAVSGAFHATTGTNAGYLAKARVATDTTVSVLLWPGS